MKFRETSIRTQILISFATISLVSMILISGIAYNNLASIGDKTVDLSTEELKGQIVSNIQKSASENAEIISQKFANAEAAVAKIVSATEQLFDPESSLGTTESYHDSETNTTLPDHGYDNTYGEVISNTTSTYYYYGDVLTAEMNRTIERSAYLDPVFREIHSNNPNYVWLYVAFKDGVFRNFPGAFVDLDREYNPPQEDWYLEAVAARGDLVYSPPYFDITQGLVVSLTQAVYVNGDLVGVVGLDFKTTTIRDKVLDVNFLEQGYATLFQRDDFVLVAHPDWDSDSQDPAADLPTINDVEKNLDGTPALSISQLNRLQTEESGTFEFLKNGEDYIMTFSSITVSPGSLYDFAVIIKLSEAIASVKQIQADITSKQDALQNTLLVMASVIMAVIILYGLYFANSVSKPIVKLTEVAKQITMNAAKDDLFEGVVIDESLAQDDEIGDLTRSFSDMVEHLREDSKKKKGKEF